MASSDECGGVEPVCSRLITLHVLKTLRGEGGFLPAPTEINMTTIFENLAKNSATKSKQACITGLPRPYTQITPFTHDLVKAIAGLAQFHQDIARTDGCSLQFLSGPCTELSIACDKYETFLELIAFPEVSKGAVPSLDLDLVWHTHQLDGCPYKETIVELTGIYADHKSCSEDPEFFDEADKETRRRWDDIFGSSVPLHATKPVFGTHTSSSSASELWTKARMRDTAPPLCQHCGGGSCEHCKGSKFDTNSPPVSSEYRCRPCGNCSKPTKSLLFLLEDDTAETSFPPNEPA